MKLNIKQPLKTLKKGSFSTKLLQSFLLATTLLPVYADDTEIFYTESEVNSNVLFVMDNSGSMTTLVDGTSSLKDVTQTFPITSKKDDVEEENIDDWWVTFWTFPTWNDRIAYINYVRNDIRTNSYSSDLELAREDNSGDGTEQFIGLRFQNVNIPADTEIKSAYIQFTSDADAHDVSSDPATLKIQVENRHTPAQIVHDAKVYSKGLRKRSYHGTSVTWTPPAWDTPDEKGDAQRTPDIKSLVQLAVDKGGWSEGKPMAFKISGTGKRSAQSFDYDNGTGAPELIITYEKYTPNKTRMEIMQDALKTVLDDAPSNLSVGISHYGDRTGNSSDKPNGIKFPTTSVNTLARPIVEAAVTIDGVPNWSLNNNPTPSETVTVREYLTEIAASWEAKGSTPIVDALYEAALYYRGDPLYWGNGKAKSGWAANATTYTTPAPDLVEAIVNTTSKEICAGNPYTKTVYGDWSINQVRNGAQSWSCPSDVDNPPGAAGYSPDSCLATEYDCYSYSYWSCLDWQAKVKETYGCTRVGPDEDGKYSNVGCKTRVISEAYCKNASNSRKDNRYFWHVDEDDSVPNGYKFRSSKRCRYKKCKNITTKNPVPEYVSPAISDCQSNNIILMSDGKPEYKGVNGVNTYPRGLNKVKALIKDETPSCEDSPFGFKSGTCGKELTHHLADYDINPGLDGDQVINTYVIGFSSGISEEAEGYLKSLVTLEDDIETDAVEGYFSAQNEEELAAAFTQTLEEIAEEARSQASPGYSVNVKSGLEHEDDIYIPVFDKNSGSRWSGNLKKFKLVDENGHRYIRGKVTKAGDSNSVGYINAMTDLGLFKDDAWDEWSNSNIPDGNNVEKGGTASLLDDPRHRNLYTNVVSSKPLYHSKNRLVANNNNIKNNMLFDRTELGLSNSEANAYRKKLVSFIRGWANGDDGGWGDGEGHGFPEGNIPAQSRKHMGDMLHSEPVVLTYQQGNSTGSGKEQYIFVATNEGYLHVFDSTTGEEVFAFMPQELLKNIPGQFTNDGDHVYGIDGSLSYFIRNDNHNGQVDGDEEVWLYFGLRRGGKSYYALNVTDINRPTLEWVVDGGTEDFAHLDQSWSAPYIANSKVNGVKKPVVIFTGGNDADQMDYGSGDDYTPTDVVNDVTTNTANGLYIVDAFEGTKLWDIHDAGVDDVDNKLTHGIPGGARILDINRNGYLDRLYFADTGGYVWRLDLKEDLSNGSILTKFAYLGGDGTSDARKFYNEPDVAILRGSGKTVFSVSIGSGLRPHPMNEEISDNMFVLIDKKPFVEMDVEFDDPIILDDLEEVHVSGSGSSKSVGKSTDFEGKKITEVSGKRGWRATFGQPGEKILANSITFEGSIIFTTLVPKALKTGELISVCATPSTQGRLYAMNLLTGEASMDMDDVPGDPNDNDVFLTISASEIPSTPQRVFNSLECSNGHCEHDVDIRIGKKSTEVGSIDVESIESVYWNTPETVQ